jgi:hypothetical protein
MSNQNDNAYFMLWMAPVNFGDKGSNSYVTANSMPKSQPMSSFVHTTQNALRC